MEQYAIYLRKSRADLEAEALGEGETLARHYNMLMKLAEKHNILPNQITIYKEIVSGESISERPQVQALLNDVYQKKYVGVLVVEIERLARGNTKDQGEVAEAFQFSNTKIITPVKVYDPNNEFDQEYFEFGLFMSRREYKTIRRRMEAGRQEAVAEGNYIHSVPPFGYEINRIHRKNRTLTINPDEAKVVKLIFDMFTEEHLAAGAIARKLTLMGIPSRTNSFEWCRMSVRNILTNIHYTGMIKWHYTKYIKEYNPETHSMNRKRRIQKADDVQLFKGKHEAIITMEQFEKAQSLFAHQPPVKSHDKLLNQYTGLIKCAKCGAGLRFDQHSHYAPKYVHQNSAVCHIKGCWCTDVDNAIIEGLKSYIDDFEIQMTNEKKQMEIANFENKLQLLETELSKQEKKRRKLFDAFEDGIYTNIEFIERKNILNETIENLKNEIHLLNENKPTPIDYENKIVTLHQAIELIKDSSVDVKAKNLFLKSFIEKITLDSIDLGKKKGAIPIVDIYLK